MINLRYHIVSIVAVFLALGIGLALGSTFVDSVLVSNLESQVNQLAESENAAVAATGALEGQIVTLSDELAATESAVQPLIGVGRLDAHPVIIVASESVGRAHIETLRSTLLSSGANYGGIVWINEALDLSDVSTREEIAALFGLAGDGEGAVTRGLTFLLSQAMFDPGAATITDPNGQSNATALTVLRDKNLLAYEATFAMTSLLETLPRENTRFLFVTDDLPETQLDGFFVPLLERIEADGYGGSILLTDPEGAAGLIDAVRASGELVSAFSTVDASGGLLGQISTIITLEQLPELGHHGQLDSAFDRLPSP